MRGSRQKGRAPSTFAPKKKSARSHVRERRNLLFQLISLLFFLDSWREKCPRR